MGKLSENWLTESHIDFELKKYTVLGYLQQVQEEYRSNKLYPCLSELIEHYKMLLHFKNSTDKVKDAYARELHAIDLKNWSLKYKTHFEDAESLAVLHQIIDFAMPLFALNIQEGKTIYDLVEEHLKLQAVGISPMRTQEGYLLLHTEKSKEIHAFQYAVSFYQNDSARYRSISTLYVCDYTYSLSHTYQLIKSDLISKNKNLPNPAVYAIDCDLNIPLQHTFLPIAKRYFATKMDF